MSGAARRGTRRARGECCSCHRPLSLRDDGTLIWHKDLHNNQCPGSNEKPERRVGPAPDRAGARALREAANAWQYSEWAAGAPASPVAQWLRERADQLERSEAT